MLRVRQFSRLSARLRAGQPKHIRAQAGRNQSSAVALAEQNEEPAAPTFVPRGPGVTDGKWDQQDEAAVSTALRDAEKVVKKRSSAQPGTIPLQPHKGLACGLSVDLCTRVISLSNHQCVLNTTQLPAGHSELHLSFS